MNDKHHETNHMGNELPVPHTHTLFIPYMGNELPVPNTHTHSLFPEAVGRGTEAYRYVANRADDLQGKSGQVGQGVLAMLVLRPAARYLQTCTSVTHRPRAHRADWASPGNAGTSRECLMLATPAGSWGNKSSPQRPLAFFASPTPTSLTARCGDRLYWLLNQHTCHPHLSLFTSAPPISQPLSARIQS